MGTGAGAGAGTGAGRGVGTGVGHSMHGSRQWVAFLNPRRYPARSVQCSAVQCSSVQCRSVALRSVQHESRKPGLRSCAERLDCFGILCRILQRMTTLWQDEGFCRTRMEQSLPIG
jgi:hypothetical protein